MQAITKVFSDIVKPYIDLKNQTLTNQVKDMNNVYGSKNLCPTMNPSDPLTLKSWSNYFTINADGSITANGTPSGRVSIASRVVLPAGQYIMNGCPSGGNWNAYRIMFLKYTPSETVVYTDTGSTPTTVTLDEETEICIRVDLYGNYTASNLVYKPMICLKSVYDIDSTYQPYAMTNQELTRDKVGMDLLSEVGAVNYAPISLISQQDGIYNYVVADDKTITATVSSATSLTSKNITPNFTLKKGVYKLTGVATGVFVELGLVDVNGPTNIANIRGDNPESYEKEFTLSSDTTVFVQLIWHTGIPAGTYIFKLMIAPVNYTGPYVPYAKSNKELTEDVAVKLGGTPTANATYIDTSDLHYEQFGKVTHVFGNFTTKTAIASSDALVQLFTDLPNSNGGMSGSSGAYTLCLLHDNTNDGLAYRCFVSTDGALVSRYKAIPVGTYFADFTYISA